jgi:hypothetical protein
MDLKPRPNHALYLKTLRHMTPEERLSKAFELTDMTRELFWSGLRQRFPHMAESDLRRLYVRRLEKCHNRHS